MSSKIVAAFDDKNEARSAEMELLESGFSRDQVHLVESTGATAPQNGWWEKVKAFFSGTNYEDQDLYREAAYRGSYIITAEVPDERIDIATQCLERHHPVDLDQRASGWRATGWRSGESQAAGMKTTEETIPVVEEQLKVGKRATGRGGVRIHSHVVEEPVSEHVSLREEHIEVERRKVDRPLGAGDNAFQERTFEATATSEEAVVEKEARVVEEVALRKDVQQRTEEVSDTLRRTEVDVEQLGEDELHGIYDRDYARRGFQFDDFRSAYQYGHGLSQSQQYRGKGWDLVEPQARLGYESKYPGMWDKNHDVIRHGFERKTRRF